jgi:oligopeptide transport system substrate-binding protein
MVPGGAEAAVPHAPVTEAGENEGAAEQGIGVEAVDDHTLKVSLKNPDKQFPRLVANAIFRPVYGDGSAFHGEKLKADIVTNGAFRITSVGADGITLDRAENYWNSDAVTLERVKFVPKDSAEQALAAYRAGELDAVTNAHFEPLALKLLEPYDDFRRTTHSALNLYEFNIERPPFNDHRVREALAISIERERLTEGEMEGASRPALSLQPFEEPDQPRIVQDVEKAKKLLEDAGFPGGENFPAIKLMVNRNDAQQRIARSVLKMWKQNLNIDGELDVKETNELETAWKKRDFDIMRRGVVLPTSDETANMLAIFPENPADSKTDVVLPGSEVLGIPQTGVSVPEELRPPAGREDKQGKTEIKDDEGPILTDEAGMRKLYVIPLYFPTSYSLVKSYVLGFDINALDAPSLKDVRIDTNWQPKNPVPES